MRRAPTSGGQPDLPYGHPEGRRSPRVPNIVTSIAPSSAATPRIGGAARQYQTIMYEELTAPNGVALHGRVHYRQQNRAAAEECVTAPSLDAQRPLAESEFGRPQLSTRKGVIVVSGQGAPTGRRRPRMP